MAHGNQVTTDLLFRGDFPGEDLGPYISQFFILPNIDYIRWHFRDSKAGGARGHGIHAGIHWRSDTDTSLMLGEAVALGFLKDRAKTYNEPFTVQFTKFDGTTATLSNESTL